MYIGLIKISISPHTVNDHILSGLRLYPALKGSVHSFHLSSSSSLCLPWVLDSCFYRSTYIVLQVLWRFFSSLSLKATFHFKFPSKFVFLLENCCCASVKPLSFPASMFLSDLHLWLSFSSFVLFSSSLLLSLFADQCARIDGRGTLS